MGVSAAIAGAAVIGAGATMYSGNKAAKAQTNAANSANALQLSMFNAMQENLSPYMEAGAQGLETLQGRMPELTAGVNMDQATLEQTPGYQFNLTQGLKSVQNSAAARGLGVSGASQKAAAEYASGLASNTYQQQFENAITNQTNTFNRLMGLTNLGQASAAGVGAAGLQTASNVGSNTMSAANARAANYLNAGNAISGAANNIGSMYMMNNLTGGKLFG